MWWGKGWEGRKNGKSIHGLLRHRPTNHPPDPTSKSYPTVSSNTACTFSSRSAWRDAASSSSTMSLDPGLYRSQGRRTIKHRVGDLIRPSEVESKVSMVAWYERERERRTLPLLSTLPNTPLPPPSTVPAHKTRSTTPFQLLSLLRFLR